MHVETHTERSLSAVATSTAGILPKGPSDIRVQVDLAASGAKEVRLWAKGHHDAGQFLIACEWALERLDGRKIHLQGRNVQQTYWRTMRANKTVLDAGLCTTVRVPAKPGCGAYAVTSLVDWIPLNDRPNPPQKPNMTNQPTVAAHSSNGIAFICEQIHRITFARKTPKQAPRMSAEQARDLLCMFGSAPEVREPFPDAVEYYGTVEDRDAIERMGARSRQVSCA